VKFSERKGHKAISRVIQKEGMNDELRSSLWNVLDLFVWRRDGFLDQRYGTQNMENFSTALWFEYFKAPIDSRPDDPYDVLGLIRSYFFSCKWYEVYDFLEWVLSHFEDERLTSALNAILERELGGYRYVGGVFTDITDQAEIDLLEEALEDKDFPGVRAHLQSALRLLSNRDAPDYRNSIKESISAVESMAQVVTGAPKATLGDALTALEAKSKLHPALKKGFSNLYGYTSDEGGIRHAMLQEPSLEAADAKFFLLSCTSFINYLKSKI
jgi:hypothetical protein